MINVDQKSLSLLNAYTAHQHYEACPEAIVSCPNCQLHIKRKYEQYLGTHQMECNKIRCLKCNARIPKDLIEYHECDQYTQPMTDKQNGEENENNQGDANDDENYDLFSD